VFPIRRHVPAKVRVFLEITGALVEPMQPPKVDRHHRQRACGRSTHLRARR
jgi:hypothetical protein